VQARVEGGQEVHHVVGGVLGHSHALQDLLGGCHDPLLPSVVRRHALHGRWTQSASWEHKEQAFFLPLRRRRGWNDSKGESLSRRKDLGHNL